MSKKHLYVLTGILAGVAALVFLYKLFILEFPITPGERTETWRVEARILVQATGGAGKVTLNIPQTAGNFTVISQNFVTGGWGLTTATEGHNRQATYSINRAEGEHALYYRAVVHRAKTVRAPPGARAEEPEIPEKTTYVDAELSAARTIVRAATREAADNQTLIRLVMKQLNTPQPEGPAEFLLKNNKGSRGIAEVGAELLKIGGLPARAVHGLALKPDRRNARFEHWIEYYSDGAWRPYDPKTDRFETPADSMPWWYGRTRLVHTLGTGKTETIISVREAFEFTLRTALTQARNVEKNLVEFSVFGLPLQTQAVYQLLLTVPVGILLLVILRNVIGMKTFGTFMPVLIALAFRQTELVWGIVLFGIVLSIGIGVRFYLERLKLLLVPRLASVVIVVVVIMAFLSIVSHKLGFDRGLSVALFPIVILAMTIERMTIVWDERGPQEAFKQAFGSLIVSILCYLAMNLPLVQHLVFVFPETLLVVLAGTLLLGRYSGYRLLELPRFRVLGGGR